MYILRFDGLFRSVNGDDRVQAGLMCYGWLIFHNQSVVARGSGGVARACYATSNGAEYLALIEGLEAMLDLGVEKERVKVFGDAKSVIQQMQGHSAVNSEGIRLLYKKAELLARKFSRIQWVWTPRSKNKAADQLTRHALRRVKENHERFQAAMQAIQMGQPRASRWMPLVDLRVYHVKPRV